MKDIQLKYKWEDLPAASVALVESSGFAVRMTLHILRDESITATADLHMMVDGAVGPLIGRIANVTPYAYWEKRNAPADEKLTIVKYNLECEVWRLISAKWGQRA